MSFATTLLATLLLPALSLAAPTSCPSTVNTLPSTFNLFLSSANTKFNNQSVVFAPPNPDPNSQLHLFVAPVLPIQGAAYPTFPLSLNNGVLSLNYENIVWNAYAASAVVGLKPAFQPIQFSNASSIGSDGGKDKAGWSATIDCNGKTTLSLQKFQSLNVLINQLAGVPEGSPDAKDWPVVNVEAISAAEAKKRCGSSGVCFGQTAVASA